MVAIMSSVWTLATISTQIITIPSATASAETIAQGHLLPWDSKFLGDVSQPGVSIVTLDDQHLVQDGGKNRRLTKVQLWCGPQGPISMIPWYSESDDLSIKGDARQWTWGKNPPEGTYKELVVNHDNEYFRMTKVQSCGKPGRRRICFFYIQKWNSFTRRYTSVRCGGQDQDGEWKALDAMSH